jgi:mono/diheme cytochrome c family protein
MPRAEPGESAGTRWWKNPGFLVFFVTAVLAAGGWVLVYRATQRIPVEQATLGGLHLELDQARWVLDQMDHGENFQKPSTMMPDMPEWGKQRVTLDLIFENRSDRTQVFDGREFFLVPELGEEVPPIGAQTGRAELGPGQSFNTAVHFDLDTSLPHGKLRVAWRRDGGSVYLPVPEPAEHYHLRPRGGEVALPPDAQLLLPIGRPERGKQLFDGVYGCVACHGAPELPGTNNIGPHLASIGREASGRIEGMPPEQYIYESIIEPGAFIAPECQKGRPCAEPTAMPEYASLMSLQDVADLLLYLLEQKG